MATRKPIVNINGTLSEIPSTDYIAGLPITIKITSDVVNDDTTANTIANITGLSFPVVSGTTYRFSFVIPYTSAATTTGSRFSINGPTNTSLSYHSRYPAASNSWSVNFASAYDLPAFTNVSSMLLGNLAFIDGVITPSADGIVIARFASEIASSAITAKAGAYVIYEAI